MRQRGLQKKADLQCEVSVSMQVRLAEGRVVGLVFIRLLSESLHSGTHQLNLCHYSFNLFSIC